MLSKHKHRKENYVGEITRIKIMAFTTDYYVSNGVPPSLEEIVDAIDTIQSKSTVAHHLHVLVARGDMREAASGSSRRYIPSNCHVVMDEP